MIKSILAFFGIGRVPTIDDAISTVTKAVGSLEDVIEHNAKSIADKTIQLEKLAAEKVKAEAAHLHASAIRERLSALIAA